MKSAHSAINSKLSVKEEDHASVVRVFFLLEAHEIICGHVMKPCDSHLRMAS